MSPANWPKIALARKEASDYHFLLADGSGHLVGYTCFGRIPLTQERYDLYWIVVDGNVQQQGIATQLLKETEKTVKALGGKAIYAETSSRAVYAPAHRFYKKHGYEQVALMRDFYADGDDKIVFAKRL